MLAIEYTMDNGEKYWKTKCSFHDGAPYTPTSATIEVESQLEKSLYFTVDNGTRLVTSHINSFKFIDNWLPNTAGTLSDIGVCDCCGQRFVERTRRKPAPGHKWGRILGPHRNVGVCPKCYSTFGHVHGDLVAWKTEEWTQYCGALIAQEAQQALAEAIGILEADAPGLLAQVKAQLAPLQAELTNLAPKLAAATLASQVDDIIRKLPPDSRACQALAQRRKAELVEAARHEAAQRREQTAEAALSEARKVAESRGFTPATALFKKVCADHAGTEAAATARRWLEKHA